MHWTSMLNPADVDPNSRIGDDLPCIGCGYNLRGLVVGQNCPECGRHASDALQPFEEPVITADAFRHLNYAALPSFGFILMWLGTQSLWIGWVGIFGMIIACLLRSIGAYELWFRSKLRTADHDSSLLHMAIAGVLVEAGIVLAIAGTSWHFAFDTWTTPWLTYMRVLGPAWVVASLATLVLWVRLGHRLVLRTEYEFLRTEILIVQIALGLAGLVVALTVVALPSLPGWLALVSVCAALLLATPVVLFSMVVTQHIVLAIESSTSSRLESLLPPDEPVDTAPMRPSRTSPSARDIAEEQPIPLAEPAVGESQRRSADSADRMRS